MSVWLIAVLFSQLRLKTKSRARKGPPRRHRSPCNRQRAFIMRSSTRSSVNSRRAIGTELLRLRLRLKLRTTDAHRGLLGRMQTSTIWVGHRIELASTYNKGWGSFKASVRARLRYDAFAKQSVEEGCNAPFFSSLTGELREKLALRAHLALEYRYYTDSSQTHISTALSATNINDDVPLNASDDVIVAARRDQRIAFGLSPSWAFSDHIGLGLRYEALKSWSNIDNRQTGQQHPRDYDNKNLLRHTLALELFVEN